MSIERDQARPVVSDYCAMCGAGLIDQGRFCPGCGQPVAGRAPREEPPTAWFDEQTTDSVEILQPQSVSGDTPAFWDEAVPVVEGPQRFRFVRPEQLSGRWLAVGALVVVLLLIASAAGVAGYRHLRDQPARDAFEKAQRTFSPVIKSFSQADNLEQVAMAGSRSAASLVTLTGERRTAAAVDSELGRMLTSVLDAEVAVVVAGATVADLDVDNYSSWGSAHQALTTSLARLTATSTRMTARDKGLASTIPGARDVLPNLETVVGTVIAQTASSSLTHDLGDLAAAETTADVRDVAESAARDSDALTAAGAGLPKGDLAAQRLDTFAGVYVAISGFSALDGDSLGRWGDMRRTITTALGAVRPGTPVTGAGHKAIDRLNALVVHAQTQLTDWQAAYDVAVKKKAADSAALNKYRSAMEAQIRGYSALRSDLSEWIDRVEDPTITVTYDDAYTELSQAQWDRQAIRDQMNASSVPDGLQGAHTELVGVVDDAIAALQSAYDGAADSDNCFTSCYYKDTPGWKRFSSESTRITNAYRAADEHWHAAVVGAESATSHRELPVKPTV